MPQNPSYKEPTPGRSSFVLLCVPERPFVKSGLIGNVFAYRATDQIRLAETDEPAGLYNDAALRVMARKADLIVMAYGTPRLPELHARGGAVASMLMDDGTTLHVLRLSTAGRPVHPLYLPNGAMLVEWCGP